MKHYDSLEARIAATYLETLSPLRPADAAGGAAYDFLRALSARLAAEPLLLFPSLHQDDAYTRRFNKNSEGKPALYGYMKAALKRIDALWQLLLDGFREGEVHGAVLTLPDGVKAAKPQLACLAALGVSSKKAGGGLLLDFGSEALAAGLATLAETAGESLPTFSRAMFGADDVEAVFSPLVGDGEAYRRLLAWLKAHGYVRSTFFEGFIGFDYAKDYGKKPTPLKGAWAEREHGGIAVKYDPYMAEAVTITLRIPRLAELLRTADAMPDSLRRFLLAKNKHCDGCRYCVQTDKSGKLPLKAVPLRAERGTAMLCPYFPGFYYYWTELSAADVDNSIAFLDWIDQTQGNARRDHTAGSGG